MFDWLKYVWEAIRTPIRSCPLGESAMRLVHFNNGVSQGEIAREVMLEEANPEKDTIKMICGCFSKEDRRFVKKALDMGFKVELITGPLEISTFNITSQMIVESMFHVLNGSNEEIQWKEKYC